MYEILRSLCCTTIREESHTVAIVLLQQSLGVFLGKKEALLGYDRYRTINTIHILITRDLVHYIHVHPANK